MMSTIKARDIVVTQTVTTGQTGNVALGIYVRRAYSRGVIWLPFEGYNGGWYIKALDANTLQPLANTEVEITYYR